MGREILTELRERKSHGAEGAPKLPTSRRGEVQCGTLMASWAPTSHGLRLALGSYSRPGERADQVSLLICLLSYSDVTGRRFTPVVSQSNTRRAADTLAARNGRSEGGLSGLSLNLFRWKAPKGGLSLFSLTKNHAFFATTAPLGDARRDLMAIGSGRSFHPRASPHTVSKRTRRVPISPNRKIRRQDAPIRQSGLDTRCDRYHVAAFSSSPHYLRDLDTHWLAPTGQVPMLP